MESFGSLNRKSREIRQNQDKKGETPGEVSDPRVSDDGTRLIYTVRTEGGFAQELAVPTRSLGVRFTSNGLEYLDEGH